MGTQLIVYTVVSATFPQNCSEREEEQGGHGQCQEYDDVFFQLDYFVIKYEDKTDEKEFHHSLTCYKTQLMCIQ